MITGDAALTATEVAKLVGMVGSGQKKPKKGEKPVLLYEMKENRADFSYESGGGNDIGEDVPLASSSEFAFVPLDDDHSETKDTIACVPSNLRTIENMVLKNEIAVSVTGDILTKIAIDAVRSENAKRTKPTSNLNGKSPSIQVQGNRVRDTFNQYHFLMALCPTKGIRASNHQHQGKKNENESSIRRFSFRRDGHQEATRASYQAL